MSLDYGSFFTGTYWSETFLLNKLLCTANYSLKSVSVGNCASRASQPQFPTLLMGNHCDHSSYLCSFQAPRPNPALSFQRLVSKTKSLTVPRERRNYCIVYASSSCNSRMLCKPSRAWIDACFCSYVNVHFSKRFAPATLNPNKYKQKHIRLN